MQLIHCNCYLFSLTLYLYQSIIKPQCLYIYRTSSWVICSKIQCVPYTTPPAPISLTKSSGTFFSLHTRLFHTSSIGFSSGHLGGKKWRNIWCLDQSQMSRIEFSPPQRYAALSKTRILPGHRNPWLIASSRFKANWVVSLFVSWICLWFIVLSYIPPPNGKGHQ